MSLWGIYRHGRGACNLRAMHQSHLWIRFAWCQEARPYFPGISSKFRTFQSFEFFHNFELFNVNESMDLRRGKRRFFKVLRVRGFFDFLEALDTLDILDILAPSYYTRARKFVRVRNFTLLHSSALSFLLPLFLRALYKLNTESSKCTNAVVLF